MAVNSQSMVSYQLPIDTVYLLPFLSYLDVPKSVFAHASDPDMKPVIAILADWLA